jgi:hypothetical protein
VHLKDEATTYQTGGILGLIIYERSRRALLSSLSLYVLDTWISKPTNVSLHSNGGCFISQDIVAASQQHFLSPLLKGCNETQIELVQTREVGLVQRVERWGE